MPASRQHLLAAYSWSINNIGDIGITPGLFCLLDRCGAPWPVVVLASQPAGDPAFAKAHDYLASCKPGVEVLANPFLTILEPSAARRPGSALHALTQRWGEAQLEAFRTGCLPAARAQALADDLLGRFTGDACLELQRENPQAAAAFDNAGFLLYNSGTTLNFGRLGSRDLWGYSLLWAMPLLLARRLGVPYGVNGQSFEAMDWPWDLIMRPIFKDARFVHCRDTDSLQFLTQRDLLSASSAFSPDSTFFFRRFDDPWAEAFRARHGLKPKQYLTLTVRIPSDQPHYHDPVGGAVSPQRRASHIAKLKTLVETWVQSTGLPVVFCPETRDEILRARTRLFDVLAPETQRHCVYMDEFWTTEQAYSIYRDARIVVSMEMHTIIMAINVGTPVLHPPFAECGRKRQMVADAGLPDWVCDLDQITAQDLADKALAIHRDYPAAEALLRPVMPRLEQRARETIAQIQAAWRQPH